MKKKLLIELAVLLILVVVVVGCRGGEVKTKRIDVKSSSSGVIKTINMQGHWKGEDLREAFVTETVKESEARNPDVKVNIKWNADFPGGREGALQATIDELKSGKTDWDIIWLEPFYYQEIAEGLSDPNWGKNYLVDFEAVPEFKESQKSFILSDPQFRNHMNGVITGPYIEGFYQPFFYNKDLTDKIGINIKESGMTFDDLLGYFKTIDDYNKAHGTNISILYDSGDYKGGIGYGPSTWNLFQSLFRSEFTSLEDIQDTKHSPQKLAAVKKVLTSLEQLSKYKPLIPGWEELPWFETRYYVLEDKAVFTVAGASWMYSHWHGIDARKTMKILISGFGPYGAFGDNITQKILQRLKVRKNVKKIIFPVEFDENIFRNAIQKYKPDFFLALGQHPRARKIRIERRAVNLRRSHKGEKPVAIDAKGSRYRFVNWKLAPDREARISYEAGMYVCNFCIYIVSGLQRAKHVKFAFLHIPRNGNIQKMVKFIESKLHEIE